MNKYNSIDDIIIFGSIAKGSFNPKDLDVALFLKDDKSLREIKKELREIEENVDIEIVDSIYNLLWVILIREGFSIKKGKFLFEIYRLRPVVLYRYSLKKLTPVQKVQFTRGIKKVLKDSNSKILSRSIVLVPMDKKVEFDEFLNTWNITYETESYELFPLLRKDELI